MKAAAVLTLIVVLTACATKTAPLPPAVTSPKFPDFVQPQPPPGLGTPAALERNHIAWEWLQAGDLRAAERNFASALRQAATFYPAEVGLGYVALAAKKHKDSLLHFDRAVVAKGRRERGQFPGRGGRRHDVHLEEPRFLERLFQDGRGELPLVPRAAAFAIEQHQANRGRGGRLHRQRGQDNDEQGTSDSSHRGWIIRAGADRS